MKISVLIPVYNVEQYIRRCIDSVLAQTYSAYEIIIVDDGSSDGSSPICDEYQNSYPHTIQVIHKPNAGLISARRVGLSIASGTFVCFLDSDDYWQANTLETIVSQIERTNADMVFFGYQLVDEKGKIRTSSHLPLDEGLYKDADKKLILEAFLHGTELNSLCTKCVRLSCIDRERDYSHLFHVASGEDLLQTLPMLDQANSFVVLHTPLYNYFQNSQSITQSKYLEKNISSTFLVYQELEKYVEKWDLSSSDLIQREGQSVVFTLKQLIRRRIGPGSYTKVEFASILKRLGKSDIQAILPLYSPKGNPISLRICYYYFSRNSKYILPFLILVFGCMYQGKCILTGKKGKA